MPRPALSSSSSTSQVANPFGLLTPSYSSPGPSYTSSPAVTSSSRPLPNEPTTPQKKNTNARKRSKRAGKVLPTRASPRLLVKGNVTPSRAAPFFKQRRKGVSATNGRSPTKFKAILSSSSGARSSLHATLTSGAKKRMRFSLPSPPSSPTDRMKGSRLASDWDSDDDEYVCMGEQGMGGGYYAFMSDTGSIAEEEEPPMQRRGLLALPPPLRPFGTVLNPMSALRSMRTFGYGGNGGLGSIRRLAMSRPTAGLAGGRVSSTGYLDTFVSRHKEDAWGIPRREDCHDEGDDEAAQGREPRGLDLTLAKIAPWEGNAAQVLCCEYSHGSRSFDPVPQAQWLAVGDASGQVTLLNTLEDPSADEFTAHPQWRTSADVRTIFEVSWRFDDRILAVGSAAFSISLWDVSTQSQVGAFSSGLGSPRRIAWDPYGGGNIFTSAGRDGSIHMYDMRVRTGMPCSSIDVAYSTKARSRSVKIRGAQPRSITALTYHPHRPNALFSAASVDGVVRLWDLRAAVQNQNHAVEEDSKKYSAPLAELDVNAGVDTPSEAEASIKKRKQARPRHAEEVSDDYSLRMGHNRRPHGISSIVSSASSSLLFAACTDGHVYPLPLCDFNEALPATSFGTLMSLYHPAQSRNGLYTRLAMHGDDKTLAVGCTSGSVVLWDTAGVGGALSGFEGAKGPDATEDLERLQAARRPAVLNSGHVAEINGLSWAHSASGPTLATVSDDTTIRTWRADAASAQARKEHMELDSD